MLARNLKLHKYIFPSVHDYISLEYECFCTSVSVELSRPDSQAGEDQFPWEPHDRTSIWVELSDEATVSSAFNQHPEVRAWSVYVCVCVYNLEWAISSQKWLLIFTVSCYREAALDPKAPHRKLHFFLLLLFCLCEASAIQVPLK